MGDGVFIASLRITEVVVAAVLAIFFAVLCAPLGEPVWHALKRFPIGFLVWTRLWDERVRVSCAVVMKIADKQGRVLLAKMNRRPDAYGPLGGVVKYFEAGRAALAGLGFEPQRPVSALEPESASDLRGYIPGRHLLKYLEWFHQVVHRESDTECLRRELREEMVEIGVPELSTRCGDLEFRLEREVVEGPSPRPGDGLWQVRVFRVYRFHLEDEKTKKFCDDLIEAAKANTNLVFATASEIRMGRADGRSVGSHAGYLIGSRQLRPELAPYSPG